jgi:succinate dehydrogenase / fumarate reductase cytochrome b subunit
MSSSYFSSTIGRKQIMALSGLALAGFVLTHMAGNLLLFVGPEAYNTYGYKLTSNPLIYVAEAGLIAFFLFHIIKGILVTITNVSARKTRYAKIPNGEKAANFGSRTMIYHGIVITVFVVHHLITFKYGPVYMVTYEGVEMRDLYRLVIEVFQSPLYVAWYAFAVILLGIHLSHGVYSAFQTLGVSNPTKLRCLSAAYGLLIGIGFISQPIFAYLQS